MDCDELEFLISQHFDGTLSADQEVSLRARLAADAEAGTLFEQHAKLDAALRGSRSMAVEVDADWLAARIADRIDEANARPLRLPSLNWATPLATAACLAIGLLVGAFALREQTTSQATPTVATNRDTISPQKSVAEASAVVQVALAGPSVSTPADSGYANVSVGAPANLTPSVIAALYLSRDFSDGRVSIRAAGRSVDAFD